MSARLRKLVLHRDWVAAWLRSPEFSEGVPHRDFPVGRACVASFLDPQAGPCSGRLTLDHVKEEPRMGKRAESGSEWTGKGRHPGLDRLVTVCEGHSEVGMKAGHQWNTAHRQLQRWYLGTYGFPD